MDLVAVEEILPYKNTFSFNLYNYSEKIDLNKELVCNIKVIINELEEKYKDRFENEAIVLVYGLKSSLDDEIKEIVLDELVEYNLKKENIEIFYKS